VKWGCRTATISSPFPELCWETSATLLIIFRKPGYRTFANHNAHGLNLFTMGFLFSQLHASLGESQLNRGWPPGAIATTIPA